MHNNLITDPVFTVDIEGQRECLSLPQVLEALGKESDLEFAMLRRHQHHAWFAFLVQLAAIVCHRAKRTEAAMTAADWAEHLLMLAGGEEAWCLVVDDLAKPAFMQPPVPEGTLAVLKNSISTPDALDVLIVSRNHDVKRATMVRARTEHWVFALVSLQTMQGFLGPGNYGVSRMNGGFASRPGIASVAVDDWSGRFAREVPSLLAHRHKLQDGEWAFDFESGSALLWTLPWDGKTSLSFSQVDPLYIEVCRRIRFDEHGARAVGSKMTRIDATDCFGDTGDFWTPLNRESRKSLTVSADGFSYKLVSDVAFGADWISSPAQSTEALASSAHLVARVLVRGQGETKGYHERIIPIPVAVRRLLGRGDGQAKLGSRSQQMITAVELAKNKVLKRAVLILAQGDPDDLNFKDKRFDNQLGQFEKTVDDVFFVELFRSIALPDDEAQDSWHRDLWALASARFKTVAESIPSPGARDYRARAAAERALFFSARKHLHGAFAKETPHATEHA
jgi:CRISPR system Cascade subunit CasA